MSGRPNAFNVPRQYKPKEYGEYSSGQGSGHPVPNEVAGKFNWGAFLLSWIWGIGNNTYITFLVFATFLISWIPLIGWIASLGICIWFGIKGNEWAWQNKYFESIEDFHEYQKKWATAGAIVAVISSVIIPIIILSLTLPVFFNNTTPPVIEEKPAVQNDVGLLKYERGFQNRMREVDNDIEKVRQNKEEQVRRVNEMLNGIQ